MTPYKIRKLIQGHKIAPEYKGMEIVCLPEKKALNNKQIEYKGKSMFIDPKKPLKVLEFEDRYGRGTKYKLYYYEWRPTEQVGLFT